MKRERIVLIIFVFQEPSLAWKFVQAREKVEDRRIQPETFIEQFLGAQSVIRQVKTKYGDAVKVDLLLKNTDDSPKEYRDNIADMEQHTNKNTQSQRFGKAVRLMILETSVNCVLKRRKNS
ncbi:zeta toxin family protein [Parashewanella spongiae]|uniref:zeta toxin family protein n=1 Tax=Parashewanella spongiae TaxID=342950 RepID=UPI001FB3A274|nr:zeta toxin family protein [Parashewanella spongiae]MCL1079956.1 zeta toxin family protein [Parashewanella spongiae]